MKRLDIAIKQPYFMPYIGFWQEVNIVDTYVFFDDVNYIKRGWINRNNILIGGNKYLFTLALSNASQNKCINEIDICDDFVKLKKTIVMAYKNAPYFDETMQLLERILCYSDHNLARFIGNSIQEVSCWLDMSTKFLYSSDLRNDKSLKKQDKIIDICKYLNATNYYDSTGALELYDKQIFANNEICLQFVKSSITPYKQFKNDFVAGLSIIDVLMFNGKKRSKKMLSNFELI